MFGWKSLAEQREGTAGVWPARPWLARHWPELSVFLFGCGLRVALGLSYNVRLGYDFYDHARNLAWWMRQWDLPPIDWSRAAYHPPLYYILTGSLARLGVGFAGLQALSVAMGCARLGLLALGLSIYLPGQGAGQRAARLVALGLAAVLPASLLIDVMVTNESLAALLATVALVLLPRLFAANTARPWLTATGAGLCIGLAILTKVSSLVIIAALIISGLFHFLRGPATDVRSRWRLSRPMLLAVGIALLCSGWYFAWCKAHYGKAFVTGFDSWRSKDSLQHADLPYWKRRPLGYVVGWNRDIYAFPFYPSAALPEARFFPQLVAATFADYYNYGLAPYPSAGADFRKGNQRPLRPSVVAPACASVAAGTFLAVMTVGAWLAAAVCCWRRRAHEWAPLLLVPMLAVAGQLHFAVSVANDAEGLVKGSYLQFACAPLFGLLGLAISRAWRYRYGRPVAVAGGMALAAVLFYVLFCLYLA